MPAMPLDALAPDQRAVVQLVLQRGRSYEQIAELLNISEDAVRARAHAGLTALAGDVELPADKVAQVSDFLLGQQQGQPRQATRKLLRDSEAAYAWAASVRASLEDVGTVPDLPKNGARPAGEDSPAPTDGDPLGTGTTEAGPAATDAAGVAAATGLGDAPKPRPRPRPRTRPVAATEPEGARAASSSRLGGALLIGGGVLALVVVVLFLFVFGGDDDSDEPTSASASATATPTASATPQAVGQINLTGANGSRGRALMTLYASQGQLAFTLQGTNVPQNKKNEAYAVWFTTPGGSSQRLGFAQPVGKNGQLGTTGPRAEDLDKFPQWLARYKQVVVSRERNGTAKQPGPIVLRGNLPSA
jgi:Sigma-70, region 4/Anti-sigma-K factor rskA, C-terminal